MIRVTLKSIADVVGVSCSTVSLVLNNQGNRSRVSEEIRSRIQSVAREMNYHPNFSARTLKGQYSKLIGILVDTNCPPTCMRTMAHLEREAAGRGYQVVIGEAHDCIENQFARYHTLRQYGVDGVICLSHDSEELNLRVQHFFADIPTAVFIGRPCFAANSAVYIDHAAGIRAAYRELLNQGYSRIGLVLQAGCFCSLKERRRGYLEAGGNPDWIFSGPSTASADSRIDMIRQLVKDAVEQRLIPCQWDAVLMENDLFALQMLSELQGRGIAVPAEVAIIGHDNEVFGEFTSPPISSISENNGEIARIAVELMIEQLSPGAEPAPVRHIPVSPSLVLRNSIR